ncbi:MAG: adenine phosphoribosyltransferase [Bacteroidota bacterium]
MKIQQVKDAIRNVPDFPKPGIIFKDLTTAFKEPDIFRFMTDSIYDKYSSAGITKVVAVESRGFIIGGALAYRLGAGFVPVRKPGKLPAEVFTQSYELEYGTDTLEIHKDALTPDDIVLIHDDLLATGGTALATIELVKRFDVKKVYTSFICELSFLNGKEKLAGHTAVFSLLDF